MLFSLIIPTYNRPDSLRNCLKSVYASRINFYQYEVIVIIDGDSSGYKSLLNEYRSRYNNFVYFNLIPKQGPAAARNFGIKNAKGQFIGFTDDDCELADDWIRGMCRIHLDRPEIAVIGGETLVTGTSINQIVSQSLTNNAMQLYFNGKLETIFFPTCNVSLKRSVLLKYGFNETFPLAAGEDLEYFWKLFKNGYQFYFEKSLVVYHHHSSLFRAFIKQQYNYGRGNILVYKYYNDHPALKNLSLNLFKIIKIFIGNMFNVYDHLYWQKVKRMLKKKYQINHCIKSMKLSCYFLLHKIFYFLGNLHELFLIKLNFKKLKKIIIH